jgi:hypothetical protein
LIKERSEEENASGEGCKENEETKHATSLAEKRRLAPVWRLVKGDGEKERVAGREEGRKSRGRNRGTD